jgi:hypothetical protein
MKNTHSDLIPDKALLSCWNILDKIEVGQKILISQYAPNHPNLWISCAKMWIDVYGNGEFNNEYTVFIKTHKIDFKHEKSLYDLQIRERIK